MKLVGKAQGVQNVVGPVRFDANGQCPLKGRQNVLLCGNGARLYRPLRRGGRSGSGARGRLRRGRRILEVFEVARVLLHRLLVLLCPAEQRTERLVTVQSLQRGRPPVGRDAQRQVQCRVRAYDPRPSVAARAVGHAQLHDGPNAPYSSAAARREIERGHALREDFGGLVAEQVCGVQHALAGRAAARESVSLRKREDRASTIPGITVAPWMSMRRAFAGTATPAPTATILPSAITMVAWRIGRAETG